MFRNYLKVAIRSLAKSKLYSFINVTGLSVGIASCILIFLYVQDELSYDRYHERSDRIFRLTEMLHLPKEDRPQAVTSPPMGPAVKQNFPEVEKFVRINGSIRYLSKDEKKFLETRLIYADSTLFDVFSYPMLEGNPKHALTEPYSVVLSETTAKKYFGKESALGKTMKLSDTIAVKVTGVITDVPTNSHFGFDAVLSRTTITDMRKGQPEDNWFNNGYYTYLLLKEGHDYKKFEAKANEFIHKQMAEERKTSGLWYDFVVQPLTSIHLYSNTGSEFQPNSDVSYVYIFSGAAILILLIACSNFVNLSTARSLNRSKEIGLRKVVGARRPQLTFQFLGESFLFAIVAGILAILIVKFSLPYFNDFTGKTLSLHINNIFFLLIYAGIIILAGLIAGSYPAFLMSSFAPITALKGAIRHGWKDIIMRKGLVIFQFTIAIILGLGTTIVLQQLKFIQNQKIGLNKDQIIEMDLKFADLPKGKTVIQELLKTNGVENASLTDFSFKSGISNIAMLPEGAAENEITSQSVIAIDENFLSTFQIELAAGRNFSPQFPTDDTAGFIVNEAAVKTFGWKTAKDAIGKKIDWGLGKKGQVVGVVKDFNFRSLHSQVAPLIIHIYPEWTRYVAVRIKASNVSETLKKIESTWKGTATNSPFSYTFLDEDFAKMYKAENNMQSVLTLFTSIAVFVACLGLFGLAAFTIRQRYKEIAVRKVLGASAANITRLISKEFLKLVLISSLIAFPIAWFGMSRWLRDFAYRVQIGWWVFIAAAAAAALIALITVSWQAIRAAVANPVKSLRSE
jgi:putative ABC transport system permease protein